MMNGCSRNQYDIIERRMSLMKTTPTVRFGGICCGHNFKRCHRHLRRTRQIATLLLLTILSTNRRGAVSFSTVCYADGDIPDFINVQTVQDKTNNNVDKLQVAETEISEDDNPTLGNTVSAFQQRAAVVDITPTAVPVITSNTKAIGDNKRSPSSSFQFFSTVDLDGDGKLEEKEVANFLWEEIGGLDFDSSYEVNTEVNNVIRDLDVNHDKALDRMDIFNYWAKMETLLTCDEVADWVVFAVQLPESIGRVFRDNGVTGYDFPELVENDGEALLSDLHLEKSWVRKKLVRHIRARMLGVGERPGRISDFKASLVQQGTNYYSSGGSISLTWNKPTARGFPVHSYRVQRAIIGVGKTSTAGNSSSSNTSGAAASVIRTNGFYSTPTTKQTNDNDVDSNGKISLYSVDSLSTSLLTTSSSAKVCSNWLTVYLGADNEFVDTGIDMNDFYYVYRVQAWNAAGRSSWSNIDVFQPRRESDECVETNLINTTAHRSTQEKVAGHPQRSHWMGTCWSILSALVSWVSLAARAFFAIGALTASIMRFRRASAKSTASVDYLRPVAPWLWRSLNYVTTKAFGVEVVPSSMLINTANEAKVQHPNQRIVSNQMLGKCASSSRLSATSTTKAAHYSNRMSSSPLLDGSNEIEHNVSTKYARSCSLVDAVQRSTSLRSLADSESSSKEGYIDDPLSCNTCRKKYKLGKRWKHHCCRCLSTFCHKHGKVAHPIFTSCKVPGSCVCQPCLDAEHIR